MEEITLSVVIPVFNEAENIRPLVDELLPALSEFNDAFEVIFVDDGSTDSTLAEIKRVQKIEARIRAVHFKSNVGQTAAMAAGFRHARGRAVVTLDGDLQNDPADIPKLVAGLSDWDAVCGIRIRRQDSWVKKISSRIANGFRNWATEDNIVDTGCTLKAYRRECLSRLELYHGMHRFLPTLLKMSGYRVTQTFVNHRPRLRGRTKYGTWGRLMKGLSDLYVVRWMKRNRIDDAALVEIIEPVHNAEGTFK